MRNFYMYNFIKLKNKFRLMLIKNFNYKCNSYNFLNTDYNFITLINKNENIHYFYHVE